jgi:hypothetical protein
MHIPQKSEKCHNHSALSSANMNKANLDATGIFCMACARHGCFVPHSAVDLQKGERSEKQMFSS